MLAPDAAKAKDQSDATPMFILDSPDRSTSQGPEQDVQNSTVY
jgi:hypothetical protein